MQTLWTLSKFGVDDKALLLVLHCETSERWMPMSVMSGVQAGVCQIFAFMEKGQIAQREKKNFPEKTEIIIQERIYSIAIPTVINYQQFLEWRQYDLFYEDIILSEITPWDYLHFSGSVFHQFNVTQYSGYVYNPYHCYNACRCLVCSCGSVVERCFSSAKACGFNSQGKHIPNKKCIA